MTRTLRGEMSPQQAAFAFKVRRSDDLERSGLENGFEGQTAKAFGGELLGASAMMSMGCDCDASWSPRGSIQLRVLRQGMIETSSLWCHTDSTSQ